MWPNKYYLTTYVSQICDDSLITVISFLENEIALSGGCDIIHKKIREFCSQIDDMSPAMYDYFVHFLLRTGKCLICIYININICIYYRFFLISLFLKGHLRRRMIVLKRQLSKGKGMLIILYFEIKRKFYSSHFLLTIPITDLLT